MYILKKHTVLHPALRFCSVVIIGYHTRRGKDWIDFERVVKNL